MDLEQHGEMTIGEWMEQRRRERPQLDPVALAVLHLLADELYSLLGWGDYYTFFHAIEHLLPDQDDWGALALFIE